MGYLLNILIASDQNVTGTTTLNDGQWHHVAITADSAGVSLFVDGVLDASSNTGVTTPLNSNPNVFFCGSPMEGNYFDGLIDNIEQYDRALIDSEVLQLATIGDGTDPLAVNDIVSLPVLVDINVQYTAEAS